MQHNDMIFATGKYRGKTLGISRSSADLQFAVEAEVGCISRKINLHNLEHFAK